MAHNFRSHTHSSESLGLSWAETSAFGESDIGCPGLVTLGTSCCAELNLRFKDLFIYFACGFFSNCGKSGLLSSRSVRASHCRSFSYCGAWARTRASVVVVPGLSSCGSRALEHRLNSWDLVVLWHMEA